MSQSENSYPRPVSVPQASAAQSAPAGCRGGGVLCSGPVLKSLAFLGILVAIAVLSGTVLQEPIADASDWLRGQGLGGYFLLAAVGYVFLVAGGSVTLFDLICGFIYGSLKGLLVSWVVKMLSACTCFFIAKFVFHAYLRQHLFHKYVWLEALEVMVRERPWQTVTVMRLSVLPAAIKSYGMGALGAPFVPFITTASVTFAVLSWVFTDLGSRISKPSQLLHARSKSSVILELVGVVCAILMVGLGGWYGKKYTARIIRERNAAAAAAAAEEGDGKAAQVGEGAGGRGDSRRVGVELLQVPQA